MNENNDRDDFYTPTQADWDELEYDFCVACNMMLGESHEEAKESAKEWIEDARD